MSPTTSRKSLSRAAERNQPVLVSAPSIFPVRFALSFSELLSPHKAKRRQRRALPRSRSRPHSEPRPNGRAGPRRHNPSPSSSSSFHREPTTTRRASTPPTERAGAGLSGITPHARRQRHTELRNHTCSRATSGKAGRVPARPLYSPTAVT